MGAMLGIDVGSSSVIAGILNGRKMLAKSPRAFFDSRRTGPRVEVDPDALLTAVRKAVRDLESSAKKVDVINLAVMCPAWVALDARGRALTPIVTHQDRRSIDIAHDIENRVGKERHLNTTGCRPFPGGISSTTWAWYRRYEPHRLRGADLVGHLNTFLHRRLTGARVTDPSNGSFTGLYQTLELDGWSGELCDFHGIRKTLLPEVLEADRIAGRITPEAARQFGFTAGTPVMTGIMDGSAGMLLAGAKAGQLYNVCGSTDVLALCTSRPRPHEQLLTRALGIGRKWLSVSTIAAMASSIYWAREQFFRDLEPGMFRRLVSRLSRMGVRASGGVTFDPYLAGERTRIDQRRGGFSGLTLATTREHLLSAIIESLTRSSADRLALLRGTGARIRRTVAVSGGADRLDRIMRRDWHGHWIFRPITDATIRGLGVMEPREG